MGWEAPGQQAGICEHKGRVLLSMGSHKLHCPLGCWLDAGIRLPGSLLWEWHELPRLEFSLSR